ncbi:unnamed protein product [Brassicogethes aeneus]|uniref:Nudix hydrolase domain-containing protein n=1 Tax=Brassicogethes aeneus TaxID=1431903 RepID=A0A9P0BA17_BRAAE|nr:unnamed protein product [Brassicogethes aeneus]
MTTALKNWRESASLIIAAKNKLKSATNFNYKILTIKRSSKSGFMPNNYVFPGGNASSSDSDPKWLEIFQKAGYTKNELSGLMPKENVPSILRDGTDGVPKFLSLRICAIRETFEECGVLIGSRNKTTGNQWAQHIDSEEILEWQKVVHDDPNEFINLCLKFKVIPDVCALKLWSNWITPPCLSSLFNAIFFIASFKDTPTTQAEEIEVADIKWCDPQAYLDLNQKKEIMLPPPQFYELSRIKILNDVDELVRHSNERAPLGCEAFLPYRVKTKEGSFSCLPGDDFYPKNYDLENKNIDEIDHIPDSNVKHRVWHKSSHLNILYTKNYKPKAGHLVPMYPNESKL